MNNLNYTLTSAIDSALSDDGDHDPLRALNTAEVNQIAGRVDRAVQPIFTHLEIKNRKLMEAVVLAHSHFTLGFPSADAMQRVLAEAILEKE